MKQCYLKELLFETSNNIITNEPQYLDVGSIAQISGKVLKISFKQNLQFLSHGLVSTMGNVLEVRHILKFFKKVQVNEVTAKYFQIFVDIEYKDRAITNLSFPNFMFDSIYGKVFVIITKLDFLETKIIFLFRYARQILVQS